MAVTSDQITVGTTVTAVVTSASGGTLTLAHRGTAVSIFVGGVAVGLTDGLALEQNDVVTFPVVSGFALSAIVAAATEELHWMLVE